MGGGENKRAFHIILHFVKRDLTEQIHLGQ